MLDTTPDGQITAKRIADTAARRSMTQDSGEKRWYTPAVLIDRVRAVLGSIELDPASDADANARIQAERYYTIEHDGLALAWSAQDVVFNPPYGKDEATHESNQGRWSAKLLEAYEQRQVDAAILLVNASVCNHWFTPLKEYPRCEPDGRVSFQGPGDTKSPTQSSALIYFGRDVERFAEVFGGHRPHHDPRRMVGSPAARREVA